MQNNNTKTDNSVRLNKYISESGYCSRRAADELIAKGSVKINGAVAKIGQTVNKGDIVEINNKRIQAEEKEVILALNKPTGIVCTCEKKEKNNVIDYMKYPIRIYPMGRLDKESEGLLLLSNNGELMNAILKAANNHEKEYIVTVDKNITEIFIKKMSEGVPVLNRITAPCFVEKIGKYTFRIILHQGMNRQIRRMCEYLGYNVTKLKRIRIMNIKLDGIAYGKYRELTKAEEKELKRLAGII